MKRLITFGFLFGCVIVMCLIYAGRSRLSPNRGHFCYWDVGYLVPMLLTLVVVIRSRDTLIFGSRIVFAALQASILFGDKLIYEYLFDGVEHPHLIWFAVAVLSYAVCFSFVTDHLRKRLHTAFSRHCCSTCGYSLRGLPLPRCPECGTEFDPALLTKEDASES